MHNYSFHPLAEFFPLIEGEEFDALVADIKVNGLREPIKLLGGKILDGRNRYRACIAAGFKPYFTHLPAVDPIKYVISANILRRHLTAEQKRDLIAKLLKANPEKSDRQIGKMAQVSKNTAKSVRDEMEARGQIDHVEVRTDTKGRKQPAKKPPTKPPGAKPVDKPRNTPSSDNGKRDVPPASSGETERKLARLEELEHENVRLRRENLALRSEIEELRAVLKAAPDGDGLDIPEWLRRAAP